MKKSNSFINRTNLKDKEYNKFESMKKLLHFPSKQIKSNILLNCFSKNKFSNLSNKGKQSEYTLILNQKKKELNKITKISANHSFMYYNKILENKEKKLKNTFLNVGHKSNLKNNNIENKFKITESDESSHNFNIKVGLNAAHSFNELSNNDSFIEQNIDNKKNKNSGKSGNNIDNFEDNINDKNNIKIKFKKDEDYKSLNKSDNNIKSKINDYKNNINKPSPIKYNNINKNIYDINKISTKMNNYSLNHIKARNLYNQDKNKNLIINYNIKLKQSDEIKNNRKIIINKSCDKTKNRNDTVFKKLLVELNSEKDDKIIKKRKSNINSKRTKNNNNIDINKFIISNAKNEHNNKIQNTNESIISSDIYSADFNNINSPTSTKKSNLINNAFYITQKFIENKNNHFKIDLDKLPPSANNMKHSKKNLSKSPLNSITGRTKDKTHRTINRQQNIIINIKQNFQTSNTPKKVKHKSIPQKQKNSNENGKNKGIDIGYYYRRYIEGDDYKEKINPCIQVYQRQLLLNQKKEKKLEEMRKRKDEDEMIEMKNTPTINNFSRKLTKNVLPIYQRLNEIEYKKNLNTEKIKKIINKENEIDENTINDKCSKNTFNKKNFQKWLLANESWNVKKNLKMEKIKNIINQEKEESEIFEFKPKINKNSEKIFYNKFMKTKYPVEQRLIKAKDEKESSFKKIEEEEFLSFMPEINKDYEIRNQYYEFMEEDQAEIYNELKEKIENEEKKI